MASRDIRKLDSRIRPLVKKLLETRIDGHEPFITDGLRSNEEQTKLYNQGRTTPGKIVTYAEAGQSPHNHGLAVDLAWRRPGTKEAKWTLSLYKKLAPKAKELGLTWGGTWANFKDNPHYELNNWREFIGNSEPVGEDMSSDDGNSDALQECLKLHTQLVDETTDLKKEIEGWKSERTSIETDIKNMKSEYEDEIKKLKVDNEGKLKLEDDLTSERKKRKEEKLLWEMVRIDLEAEVEKFKQQARSEDLSLREYDILIKAFIKRFQRDLISLKK